MSPISAAKLPGHIAARASARLLRAVQRKGSYNYPSPDNNALGECTTTGFPLLCFRKEVKDGAVVPNAKLTSRMPVGYVGNFPLNLVGQWPQPRSCCFKSRGGNVQHCDVLPALLQKRIYKVRSSATYIDEGRGRQRTEAAEGGEGGLRRCLIPAYLGGGFILVDMGPVLLFVRSHHCTCL